MKGNEYILMSNKTRVSIAITLLHELVSDGVRDNDKYSVLLNHLYDYYSALTVAIDIEAEDE